MATVVVRRAVVLAMVVVLSVAIPIVSGRLDEASPAPGDPVSCHLAWTTNWELGTIAQLDVDARTFSPTIAVGPNPKILAVNPDGTRALVATTGNSSVVAVDLVTKQVATPIPVDGVVSAIAFLPDGRHALVAGTTPSAGFVVPVDLAADTAGAPLVLTAAFDLAITDDGTRALVTTGAGVDVIDVATLSVTATIPLAGSQAIAVSPSDVALVTTSTPPYDAHEITLATSTVGPVIGLMGRGGHVALTPDGAFWVVTTWSTQGSVEVVGVGTAVAAIPAGTPAIVADQVAISPDGAFALIGDDNAHLIHSLSSTGAWGTPISNGPFTPPTSPIDIAFASVCTARDAPATTPTTATTTTTTRPSSTVRAEAVSATPNFTG